MPCCNIPNRVNPVFPPSLIPDAKRFSKFVGRATLAQIGPHIPITVLTSALHLEMKMWLITSRLNLGRFIINDAWHNAWVAMLAGWNKWQKGDNFSNEEKKRIHDRLLKVPALSKKTCILTVFDQWHLDLLVYLRGIHAHGGGNPVPALASFGRCQKLVNIFLKYEICWQAAGQWNGHALAFYNPRIASLSQFLCALHAPIDRILLAGPYKKKGKPKTNFGLRGTPIGRWLYERGLINNGGSDLRQSSDGYFRPWSQLDCLRTYYGLQLILRRVAIHTWPKGCACDESADAAIRRCADWFERQFGKDHPCGDKQKGWLKVACDLPIEVIEETIKELEGDKQNNTAVKKSGEKGIIVNQSSLTSREQCSETKDGQNVSPIYLNEIDNNGQRHKHALRIVNSCDDRWNLGAICWKHNCLDLQSSGCKAGRYLIGEIAVQDGGFLRETPRCRIPGGIFHGRGHTPRVSGETCCWGGSSYEAGVHFESIGAAVHYLKKYFDVRACGNNVTYDQAWIDAQ